MKTIKWRLFSLLLIILVGNCLQAQEYFYYYKGKKQVFELNTETAYVTTKATLNSKTHLSNTLNSKADVVSFAQDNIYKTINVLKEKGEGVDVFGAEISMNEELTPEAYFDRLHEISQLSGVTSVSPYFKNKRGNSIGLSNYFYVKLKNEYDINVLHREANENNITVVGNNHYMPLWYTLSCDKTSSMNTMQAANYFYETRLFQYAEPDLMQKMEQHCTTDPKFDTQWALDNAGQNEGVSGIDINMCEAWDITTGNPNIVVAVLDGGIYNHPDLQGNISSESYDLETNGGPANIYSNHGTRCAGIIAAKQNDEGGSGVAPNTTLLSMSRDFGTSSNGKQKYADAFNWSVDKNIAIISNSWGGGSSSEIFDEAVANVMENGRNGLGTVVVFSSGNNDNDEVSYPANVDSNGGMLVVGAIDNCGIRVDEEDGASCKNWSSNAPGSNYGTHLDIVAPGTDIFTTDNDDEYKNDFKGTSAACPHVSGVAALVLAVNPDLTQEEVVDIIEQSAQKLDNYSFATTSGRPNGTWNVKVGYGLVDAGEAVLLAQESLTGNPGNPDCPTPSTSDITLDERTNRIYTYAFNHRGTNHEFRYSTNGGQTWKTLPETTSHYSTIYDKLPCTTYLVQLRQECDGVWSDWSDSAEITTEGDCCPTPSLLDIRLSERPDRIYAYANNHRGINHQFRFSTDGGETWETLPETESHFSTIRDKMPCTTYLVQLRQECDGVWSDWSDSAEITTECGRYDMSAGIYMNNFPNPFRNNTIIEFTLEHESPVTLTVTDLVGKQVAVLLDKAYKASGTHQLVFEGKNYQSGVYYYTIQAGEYTGTQKMMLIK